MTRRSFPPRWLCAFRLHRVHGTGRARRCPRRSCNPPSAAHSVANPAANPVEPPSSYKIESHRSERQAQRSGRPRAGFASVREHGQRADGSQLHVSAAVRRRDRPADAARRRQGIRGQAAVERRSPAALRRDRPQEPRPGPARMGRHRHVSDERVPDSARRKAHRHAPLLAALPQELRPHRFHLPAEHGQVHVRAARQAEHPRGDRKRARRSRTSTRPRTT